MAMNTTPNYFKNKRAFITGSSRGIGRAIALELAAQGCDILIHYRKNKEAAHGTLKAVKEKGVSAWLYQADLCSDTETEALLERITEEHDFLDFYIANAASTAFKPLTEVRASHIEKTFHLIIKSFVLTVQKLRPLLKGRDSQILTISGIDTVKFCPGHGLLAAAKSALETLTKYLSVELAPDGIHTKCINPGLVATDATRFYLGEAFERILKKADQAAPHGGFSSPGALARFAVLFLRPETNWLAAQTIHPDGGLSFIMPDGG